ncbi:hypothetical protein PENOC_063800 [Penicillium occitanis (nom. inval.)]|nr:hypothetical protein PENOC_063800 [Penicillium occitanis (nom. inval.)]
MTQIIAINPFIWIAATTFAKISILCFYVSIFKRDYIRISSLIVGSIALSFCVAFVLASLSYCRPFAYIWDKTIDGKCTNVVANEISSAAINMALDLAIAMLPLPGIWALQLPARKKIEMGIMFSFGLAVCAVNVVRIYYEAVENEEDITFALVKPGLSASLEINLGIISACIAPCGPLLRHSFLRSRPKTEQNVVHQQATYTGTRISNYNQSKASRTLHWVDNDDVVLHGITHNAPRRGTGSFNTGAKMSINSINGDTIMVETNEEIDEIVACHKEDV